MNRRFSALLGLTLVLAACGQPSTGGNGNPGGPGKYNPPPPGQPLNTNTQGSYSITGNVQFSGPLSASSAPSLSPQAALAQSNWQAPHVPGVVLIRADLGSFRAQAAGVLAGLKAQSVGDGLTLVEAGVGSEREVAAKLAAAGFVTQPNYVYRLQAVVNDPGWPENEGINIGGTLYDQDYLTRINVADAWAVLGQKDPNLRKGVKVAVLDTGVNANHPDLVGHILPGMNFSVNPPNSDTSDTSANAHGTSTAGLIAASTNNGIGIAGVTWGGQILPVKVFDANGGATTVSLTGGVNYAVTQGAQVINMSLGFPGNNSDPALSQAISDATGQGRVVVAAAGNTPNDGLYYPASDPNVIAVGATYQPDPINQPNTELVACYSAQPKAGQKAVDIYAPGGPGGKANAGGNVTPCGDQNYNLLSLGPNNGYQLITGTSEAAPQVSGAVSLMLAANPGLSVSQVRSILVSSGRSFSGGTFLNVGAAVRQALGMSGGTTPPPPPPSSASYSVTLSVSQNGGLIGQGTASVDAGATSLPFYASLAAGTYTFQAKVFKNGQQVQQGSQTVNVSGNTNVNIQTK